MITPIKWNEVRTDAQWVEALTTILGDCEDSVQAGVGERIELQKQLLTFIERSPLAVDHLDEIAAQASTDIMLDVIADRISAIQKRNDALTSAAAALDVQISAANRDAGTVLRITTQLNKAAEAITAVRDMVTRLNRDNSDANAVLQTVLGGLGTLAGIFSRESN